MKSVSLAGGLEIRCLAPAEAEVMDRHAQGYLSHGVEVRPGDVVFDVGANVGVFAIRAYEHAGREATVFAFEPLPPTYGLLQSNLASVDAKRLRAFPFGLSNERGTADFTFFPNSPAISTAFPSIWQNGELTRTVRGNLRGGPLASRWTRWLATPLGAFFAWHLRRNARTFTCDIRTLSDAIRDLAVEKIDLLKIDVEGSEHDILLGIEDQHWPRVQKVVIEVHDIDGRVEAIRSLLSRHGFKHVVVEKEAGFEEAPIFNVFATRNGAD